MLAAQITLTQHSGFMSTNTTIHVIPFENLEEAWSRYEQIAALLKRKNEKANDLPTTLELEGTDSSVTMPFDELRAVSITDLAKANKLRSGMREAYPNLYT